ncbi:unnamed protein product [Phyllotreta striolata]|uniref:Ubiquitin-associated protein 1 n=1 Tax=Phyllotreta striolata TaxID=444603 RepID=A0A9N9XL02_PHYSR|nr:unnamed protein product [Phyllotreta striolata]
MSKPNNDCYTDNIKVKISEKYKPPPRINVAVTYAQRLTLNKQIEDNIPNYEFSLEKTVLNKMKEWRSIRQGAFENRKDRITKVREDINKMKQDRLEQEQVEEVELKTVNEADMTPSCSQIFGTNSNQNYGNYSISNILVPTQMPQASMQLHTYPNKPANNIQNDKSPFNIKDFENDTSSPFDNMELKSINDMEELAQVLNKDKSNYKVNTQMYPNYPSVSNSAIQPSYSNYMSSQYSYNIPNQPSNYVQPPVTTEYSRTNGYYYETSPFQAQYMYSSGKPTDVNFYNQFSTGPVDIKKPNCKSVPDIVKALEDEIENTHISTSTPQESYFKVDKSVQSNRPKSTDPVPKVCNSVYPRPKIKPEELGNPFSVLTKSEQEFCRSISSMGFPLNRVARTCQLVGDDQKKVVDHLLALTDLLDLGFSEKDISKALMECDNDKDKALDKLIS